MGHRDEVILTKILSEISIAQEMLGVLSLAEFEANELLKRAICMTVINIWRISKKICQMNAVKSVLQCLGGRLLVLGILQLINIKR